MLSEDFLLRETFSEFSLQIPLHLEQRTCRGRSLTVILLFLYLLEICTFFFFVAAFRGSVYANLWLTEYSESSSALAVKAGFKFAMPQGRFLKWLHNAKLNN